MNKWDLYDNNFKKTKSIIEENEEIPEGLYHYSINVWIINSNKQLLLIRNTLNYNLHYPGFWNSINGNVLSGDNSLDTCIKTVKSKIGIDINKKDIKSIDKQLRKHYKYIYETMIIEKNLDIEKFEFLDKTATQAKWVDIDELYNMIENGEIAWVMISRIEQYIIPLLEKET